MYTIISIHSYYAYTNCIIYYLGCPKVLRADRGTENTNVVFLQPFLQDNGGDDFAGEKVLCMVVPHPIK